MAELADLFKGYSKNDSLVWLISNRDNWKKKIRSYHVQPKHGIHNLVLELPDENKERDQLSTSDLYKLIYIYIYIFYLTDILPALGYSF